MKFVDKVKAYSDGGIIEMPRQWIGKRVWAEIKILENGDDE